MSARYHFTEHEDYFRIDMSGSWSVGNEVPELTEMWKQATLACEKLGLFRILAVFDTPGRFPIAAAYELASDPASYGLDRRFKTALVYTYKERFESNLFTETVAVNRGYDAKAFQDEQSALEWLL